MSETGIDGIDINFGINETNDLFEDEIINDEKTILCKLCNKQCDTHVYDYNVECCNVCLNQMMLI